MRESRELSPNPPSPILPNPTFHAAPLSDNLHEWHFTLLGPPSTPYAGGMYHGRIVLPSTYPLRPPSFRFLTPSGRFEVNREICLSISGFHEETWQPAWGVRLALTALRVFMTEEGKGQVGGLEASETVRKQLAERSRGWICNGGCSETGGRSNEEVMKEWWECCRAKGVQVGEDGEVVEGTAGGQQDAIPEELKLGYRDELGNQEAAPGENGVPSESQEKLVEVQETPKTPQQSPPLQQPSSLSHSPIQTAESSFPTTQPLPQPSAQAEQPTHVLTSTKPINSSLSESLKFTLAKPPSPSTSRSASPLRSPSASVSASSTSTSSSAPAPASASPSRYLQPALHQPQHYQLIDHRAVSTPILDKAISGVIIALLFMVLKKLFYF